MCQAGDYEAGLEICDKPRLSMECKAMSTGMHAVHQ
jgi:hypothetical protein